MRASIWAPSHRGRVHAPKALPRQQQERPIESNSASPRVSNEHKTVQSNEPAVPATEICAETDDRSYISTQSITGLENDPSKPNGEIDLSPTLTQENRITYNADHLISVRDSAIKPRPFVFVPTTATMTRSRSASKAPVDEKPSIQAIASRLAKITEDKCKFFGEAIEAGDGGSPTSISSPFAKLTILDELGDDEVLPSLSHAPAVSMIPDLVVKVDSNIQTGSSADMSTSGKENTYGIIFESCQTSDTKSLEHATTLVNMLLMSNRKQDILLMNALKYIKLSIGKAMVAMKELASSSEHKNTKPESVEVPSKKLSSLSTVNPGKENVIPAGSKKAATSTCSSFDGKLGPLSKSTLGTSQGQNTIICPGCGAAEKGPYQLIRHLEEGLCPGIPLLEFNKARTFTALIQRHCLGNIQEHSAIERDAIKSQSLKLLRGDNSTASGPPIWRQSVFSSEFNSDKHKTVLSNSTIWTCPFEDCDAIFDELEGFCDHLRAGHFTHGVCPSCHKEGAKPSVLLRHFIAGAKDCQIANRPLFPYAVAAVSGGFIEAKQTDTVGRWIFVAGQAPRTEPKIAPCH